QNLDIASVIKATHAISSEVRPERLFSVLIQTIIENAGAQHGYLFVRSGEADALRLAARASIGESGAGIVPVPLERCPDVAQDVVRYVARTHETLVLDDASSDKTHGKDPHIQQGVVRSLLCMPVLEQGRLLAVLYAENNAVSRAFTPARVVLLRVIAGQAAISIANAELYANLEDKVAERTRQLAEQSREVAAMLESLEQGVFTIDADLRIQPRYSRHLEQLLDAEALAGRDSLEVLFSGSDVSAERLANMRAALEFSFGAPLVFAEPNKAHWVREFQRPDARHGQRSFELDWTPIAGSDDMVSKVLVALRDVTLVKQLRASAMKHARELDIVGQILDAGIEQFQRFQSSARALLGASQAELAASAVAAAGDDVFRQLHTIKGNARLLGLSHLASSAHTAEEHLDARQRARDPSAHRRQARAAIEIVLGTLGEYDQICQRKLGDALRSPAAWNDGVDSGVAAQIAKAKAGALSPAEALAAIDAMLQRASAVPFEQIAKTSARLLPTVALELGKVAPRLDVEDRGPWLSAAWARALKESLIHVFQNSIDHGLETATERRRSGKPEQGTISVRAERTPHGATLRFWDDGRGLALASLRERAGIGVEPDEATAERIFDAGVSTAVRVTQTSGRGIGLDAVRALVRGLGGELEVVFRGPATGGFRPFELVFSLPLDAVSIEKPSSVFPRRSEPPRARTTEAPPASK
ncbi:MAG TPA: GAF domain-containing protein, partial [Polyangiaceae bacterium]|nr:GAF domain-containing protein [Polyangiaceae bacterium]